MQRACIKRMAAAMSALLVQVAAVAIFDFAGKPDVPKVEPANRLAYIQAIQMPALKPRESTELPSVRRSTVPALMSHTPEPARVAPDVPRDADDAVAALTLPTAPAVDWESATRDAARRFADDQAGQEGHERSLNSRPRVLTLPDTSKRPPRAGDTEHLEGGVVLTWLNERCYYKPDPWVPTRPVCKVRSMGERRSEELAQALGKAVEPQYLSRPLPMPDTPPTLIGSALQTQPASTNDQ